MNQDYELYYLSNVSYDALKKENAETWKNLFLTLSDNKKKVGITDNQDNPKATIGYLSDEDGKKYIPYLEKGWSNVYEAFVVSINISQQDISKRILVAVNIKEKS